MRHSVNLLFATRAVATCPLLSFRSLIVAALVASLATASAARAAERPPNIVIVYADDLGYGDVACYNPERGRIKTDRIDRLASEGMRFTDAHSSSSVCSPSRYALLTGRYHWRTRLQRELIWLWEPPLIAPDRLTLPRMLGELGYRTACIGKWHLGWDWGIRPEEKRYFTPPKEAAVTPEHRAAWKRVFSEPLGHGPTTVGFDSYFGTDVPNWPPYSFIENDRTVGIPDTLLDVDKLTPILATRQGPALPDWDLTAVLPTIADRATSFIRQAAEDDQRFFLYLPLTSPHTPLSVTPEFAGTSGLNVYADYVLETDAVVGRVLDALAQSGVDDETLVIFSSDNGCAPDANIPELESKGHYPSGPWRGHKTEPWEGGHRVAFIVRWPHRVSPGTICDQLVHQADVMSTCAEVVGASLPANAAEDSFSLLPLLRGETGVHRTSAVSQAMNGTFAFRRGQMKLVIPSPHARKSKNGDKLPPAWLYDLAADPGETHDLFAAQPETVAEMTALFKEIIERGRSTPGENQPNDVRVERSLPNAG